MPIELVRNETQLFYWTQPSM